MRTIHVGVVSPYPPRTEKHTKSSGVASYTKNLVSTIGQRRVKIFVYANIINEKEIYNENQNIRIIRCWTPFKYPLQILKNILKNGNDKEILHVQFEYFLYGGLSSLLMFPLLLAGIRLIHRPLLVTLHQVVPLSRVNKSFIKENGFIGHPLVLRWGLWMLTVLICVLSQRVIVHEKRFKEILVNEYKIPPTKILVIPHGVESPDKAIDKKTARNILNLDQPKKIILYMGYISGYKGVDVLLDAFEHFIDEKRYFLILGGGPHPRLRDSIEYIQKLKIIEMRARRMPNLKFVGFIPENLIPLYFSATDLVVFPYKVVFGSSGPMNIAIGYNRPVIVSNEFTGIIPQPLIFKLKPENLAETIHSFFRTPAKIKYAIKFIKHYRTTRSWNKVGKRTVGVYLNVIRSKGYCDRNRRRILGNHREQS